MRTAVLLTLSIFISGASVAQDVRTVDGDTIEIGSTIYRLHGIDAPEFAQKCTVAGGGTWPCGKEAVGVLTDLIGDQDVTCDDRGSDQYGRTIGVCRAGGIDLNERMVSTGYAWAFVRYSDDYVGEEATAREQRLGIWSNNSEPPWVYRENKWNEAAGGAPEGCPIKGNISDNGRIYHTPWSPWYSRTKINEAKGERWFCDEAEALAAGWRAPIWGASR